MKVTLTTLGHSRWVLIQSGRRLGLLSIKTTKENVTIFGIILKKKKRLHTLKYNTLEIKVAKWKIKSAARDRRITTFTTQRALSNDLSDKE